MMDEVIKYCSGCDKFLSSNCFSIKSNGKFQSRCRPCYRTARKKIYANSSASRGRNKRIRREKRDFIRDYKSSRGCFICEEKDCVALDMHHIDPDNKTHNVAKLALSHSLSNIMGEIKKCIILCSNCHRKLHAGRFNLFPSRSAVVHDKRK